MVTCLTHGDGIGGRGTWGFDAGGGGRWRKMLRRGEGSGSSLISINGTSWRVCTNFSRPTCSTEITSLKLKKERKEH